MINPEESKIKLNDVAGIDEAKEEVAELIDFLKKPERFVEAGARIPTGVLPYGERLKVKGLNLLSAPGNDLVAATALASCGCHMVLFTTGRGTPFGTYVPTMKISTNSTLAKNKPGWIDFNAGVIVENEPMEKTCERFIEYIIKVASGEFVNNEKKGYKEIAIFKTGVTL